MTGGKPPPGDGPRDGARLTAAICVKNGERTISAAVRSLCLQRPPPGKIIVVDDGSTDATRAEAEKGAAGTGQSVTLVANDGKGLYDGRNTALKQCDTEFLAFIDADCEAGEGWVAGILEIFDAHPEVAAGTGAHPQLGEPNWVSNLHRLWFVVDSYSGQEYVGGVVGANSYFRVAVLRALGGWISLPFGNAEDMYISVKITDAGHKIWFDERLKVFHHYTRDFGDFIMKSHKSGYAIVRMMQEAGWRNFWYYYTLCIPLVAGAAALTLAAGIAGFSAGWWGALLIFGGTFVFNLRMFRSIGRTLPRWGVRWIIIWPYALGILKALLLPKTGPAPAKPG